MRRSERLIRIVRVLLDRPNKLVTLSELADETGTEVAKSSLSEDVAMIRDVFASEGVGTVQTVSGAAGGLIFQTRVSQRMWDSFSSVVVRQLSEKSRILPGGFLYMSDVLGHPEILDTAGRMIADCFMAQPINVVVTVETKGIPLAVATARYLHVPVVVVRREHRVTDGASVSVHYVSGSNKRIQTMSVSKRAMPQNAHALIVDDFMRAGATAQTVQRLLAEFGASVAGTAVFMSTTEPAEKMVSQFVSLFTVDSLEEGQDVFVSPGLHP